MLTSPRMIELLAIAFGGFVAFLAMLLRSLPLRPGERDPEHLLALGSIIVLLVFLGAAFGLIAVDSWARIAALYGGMVAGYLLSRLFPRREPDHAPRSAKYLALSRQADETFQAMKDAAARGEEVSREDALKLESYAKRMVEFDHPRRPLQHFKLILAVATALFVLYLLFAYLRG